MSRSSTDGSTAGIIVLAAGAFDLFLAVVFAALVFLVPDARVAMAITAAVLGVSGVGAVVIGLRLRARGAAEDLAPAPVASSFEPPPPGAVPTYPPVYAGAAEMGDPETLAAVQAAVTQTGSQASPVFAAGVQSGYTVEQLRAYLRQYGIEGSARIDRLEDTGRIVGDERVFTTTVTVEVPGQPSRVDGPSATMIPIVALHKVAVGRTVPIRVAPDNPHLLMFEWDRV